MGSYQTQRYLRADPFDLHPSGIYFDPREQEDHEFIGTPDDLVGHFANLNSSNPQSEEGASSLPLRFPSIRLHQANVQISKPPTDRHITYIPLLGVSAKVSIKTLLAETVLTQKFENHSGSTIKSARYTFPLHPGCVVRTFRCKVGEKKELVTQVEANEEARIQFDRAVHEKKTAALLEEHTVEIFEVNLGNIPAHQHVTVQISFVGELKVDFAAEQSSSAAGVILTLPTSIAPRYGHSPEGFRGDGIGSTVDVEGLDIQVDISMPFRILGAECLTHPVSFTIGSLSQGGISTLNAEDHKKANVKLKNRSASLGRDFVLLVKLSQPISHSTALVEPHHTVEDHCAMMVSISPRDFLSQIELTYDFTGEIIFVVDCSGSMRDKVRDLRDALRVCLRGLQRESFFNICLFGSPHHLLWDTSQPVNKQTIDKACSRVATLDANMGGTEILPALQYATKWQRKDVSTSVLVITDGECWEADNIMTFVRNSHKDHDLHYFCLGIGNHVSHALIEGIATSGGGLSEVVPANTDADWRPRVVHLLTECMNPSNWELELEVGERIDQKHQPPGCSYSSDDALRLLGFSPPSFIQAPNRIPKSHTLSRISVYLLLDKSAQRACEDRIIVKGRLPTGDQAQITLQPEKLKKNSQVVHPLAAKELWADIENETAWPFSEKFRLLRESQSCEFSNAIRQEAVSFGKAWSIASKWTSFIAVEEAHQKPKQNVFLEQYRPTKSALSELERPRINTFQLRTLPATPKMTSPEAVPYHGAPSKWPKVMRSTSLVQSEGSLIKTVPKRTQKLLGSSIPKDLPTGESGVSERQQYPSSAVNIVQSAQPRSRRSKTISRNMAHTTALPSRLSAKSIIDYEEQPQRSRSPRDTSDSDSIILDERRAMEVPTSLPAWPFARRNSNSQPSKLDTPGENAPSEFWPQDFWQDDFDETTLQPAPASDSPPIRPKSRTTLEPPASSFGFPLRTKWGDVSFRRKTDKDEVQEKQRRASKKSEGKALEKHVKAEHKEQERVAKTEQKEQERLAKEEQKARRKEIEANRRNTYKNHDPEDTFTGNDSEAFARTTRLLRLAKKLLISNIRKESLPCEPKESERQQTPSSAGNIELEAETVSDEKTPGSQGKASILTKDSEYASPEMQGNIAGVESSSPYSKVSQRYPAREVNDGEYSFTDPASTYKDTAPIWRGLSNSIDSRNRQSTNIMDSYGPRKSARGPGGPPVTTRGFDKINCVAAAANRGTTGRASSLRERWQDTSHERPHESSKVHRNPCDVYSGRPRRSEVDTRDSPSDSLSDSLRVQKSVRVLEDGNTSLPSLKLKRTDSLSAQDLPRSPLQGADIDYKSGERHLNSSPVMPDSIMSQHIAFGAPHHNPYPDILRSSNSYTLPKPGIRRPLDMDEKYEAMKRTMGTLCGINSDSSSVHEDSPVSEPEGYAVPSIQTLSMDELIDSISTTGYWKLASEKAELLQSFFSTRLTEQMSEEIDSFKLADESDKMRIEHTALVIVYLEREFPDHLQLLGLLLKKAKRWLHRTLLDGVDRNMVQELAREAWLGNTGKD